jgi:peptidoglycan/LPS O-acetylase OafA/YrhL
LKPFPSQHHANSFTFLRLALALTVVFGHSCVIGGFGEEPLGRLSGGTITGRELAVQGFFIISGYLLTHSLLRNPSLARFFTRRAFRILPGYWLALIVTSLAVAPGLFAALFPGKVTYAESLTIGDYNALGYLGKNWLLWQGQKWILPLFLKNHVEGIVNGSLWSLFYEALCYLALAVGAWLGWLNRRWIALASFGLLYAASVVHAIAPLPALPKGPALNEFFNMALHPAGPCVVLAFVAGVATRLLSRGAPVWNTRWFLIALTGLAISFPLGAARVIWPLALPYLLVALAERLPFRKLEQIGDFSYGIYIYSFLIQQCLFVFGWQHQGFWIFLGLSLGLSVAAGAASWFLVERPAIAWGQRFFAGGQKISSPILVIATPAESLANG